MAPSTVKLPSRWKVKPVAWRTCASVPSPPQPDPPPRPSGSMSRPACSRRRLAPPRAIAITRPRPPAGSASSATPGRRHHPGRDQWDTRHPRRRPAALQACRRPDRPVPGPDRAAHHRAPPSPHRPARSPAPGGHHRPSRLRPSRHLHHPHQVAGPRVTMRSIGVPRKRAGVGLFVVVPVQRFTDFHLSATVSDEQPDGRAWEDSVARRSTRSRACSARR